MFFIRATLALTLLVGVLQAKNFDSNLIRSTRSIENCETIEDELDDSNTVPIATSGEICTTPACVDAASTISQWMKSDVNPCDDFYKFACGNFGKEERMSKLMLDNMEIITEKTKQMIKKNLEKDVHDNDPKVFKKIQTFYETCIDTAQIDKAGPDNLRDILGELGGWPVLEGDSWNATAFDWKNSVYKSRKNYKFDFFFTSKFELTTQKQVSLTLNKVQPLVWLGDKDNLEAYHKFMYDMAEIFGVNKTQAKKDVEETIKFELELSNIKDDNALHSVKALQAKYPDISWREVISPYMSSEVFNSFDAKITLDLKSLFRLISNTPKRILANYIAWTVVSGTSIYMGGKGQRIADEFIEIFVEDEEAIRIVQPRWSECIEILEKKLPLALGALYVRRNFDLESRNNIVTMTRNLKKSLKNMFLNVKWTDDKIKKGAAEKLDHISELIPYGNEFLDDKVLEKYHENLKVYSKNYPKSYLSVDAYEETENSEIILQNLSNRSHWTHQRMVTDSNAKYNPIFNYFEISPGILRGVLFSKDRPNYLNYGAIGHVIAHELAHAFDYKNRIYDKEGNIRNWHHEETEREYKKRASCMVDQYNSYEILGVKNNGSIALDENIADNIGLKGAYRAYIALEKENKVQELRLPGLSNYTPRQMFWISAANTWCSKTTTDKRSLQYIIENSDHSLHEFRVKGMISNQHGFSKDFNCPANSKMNPSKKFGIL